MSPKILITVLVLMVAIGKKSKAGCISCIGDTFMISLPIYGLGMATKEDGWTGTIQLTSSVFTAQMLTEGLKRLTKEPRPDYKEGDDKISFPSGHAAAAFSAASFIRTRYGWKKSIAPYITATYVAYSRVEAKKHYVHDVVAGALVAEAVNYLLVTPYEGDSSLAILPTPDLAGAQVRYAQAL